MCQTYTYTPSTIYIERERDCFERYCLQLLQENKIRPPERRKEKSNKVKRKKLTQKKERQFFFSPFPSLPHLHHLSSLFPTKNTRNQTYPMLFIPSLSPSNQSKLVKTWPSTLCQTINTSVKSKHNQHEI